MAFTVDNIRNDERLTARKAHCSIKSNLEDNPMKKAIIGHTGFVGGNVIKQAEFDCFFNTSNINDLKNQKLDLLVIAAPSAAKWQANQEPERDQKLINDFIDLLSTVKADKVVHISTVDVYKNPRDVNENTPINPSENHAYGKHRFLLENFIRNHFNNHLIVRLPGLFGQGLKKNFIFDMLNTGDSVFTHKDSVFQFYCLDNIWKDIVIAMDHSVDTINFATEPVSVIEIADSCFHKAFTNVTANPPAYYDMATLHASLYGKPGEYLYDKQETIDQLKAFIKNYEK